MLKFLVTSKARRRLLMLLWSEDARGTVGALAERAGVAFSQAHRELKRMRQLGLVRSDRESGRELFRANERHPYVKLLRELASADTSVSADDDEVARTVRRRLKALGAPLNVELAGAASEQDVEAVLVEGARLARRDPTVARTLPLCFWQVRDSLQWKHLLDAAASAEEKHALGFFLDLTGELSEDARFGAWATMFRDRRMRAEREFFLHPTRRSRALAEERTPAVARKWGFVMNMELQSFQDLFDKFADLHG